MGKRTKAAPNADRLKRGNLPHNGKAITPSFAEGFSAVLCAEAENYYLGGENSNPENFGCGLLDIASAVLEVTTRISSNTCSALTELVAHYARTSHDTPEHKNALIAEGVKLSNVIITLNANAAELDILGGVCDDVYNALNG